MPNLKTDLDDAMKFRDAILARTYQSLPSHLKPWGCAPDAYLNCPLEVLNAHDSQCGQAVRRVAECESAFHEDGSHG